MIYKYFASLCVISHQHYRRQLRVFLFSLLKRHDAHYRSLINNFEMIRMACNRHSARVIVRSTYLLFSKVSRCLCRKCLNYSAVYGSHSVYQSNGMRNYSWTIVCVYDCCAFATCRNYKLHTLQYNSMELKACPNSVDTIISIWRRRNFDIKTFTHCGEHFVCEYQLVNHSLLWRSP